MGGEVHLQQRHILHYQRVGSGAPQVVDEPAHLVELIVVDYGVDGDIYFRSEAVGISAYASDFGHAVGGRLACAVAGGSDIHCVGAVAYGLDGSVGVACRG